MDFIEQKPGVLGGKAVVKNTRIGVDLILEKIGAGETIEELLKAYPSLKREAILACISHSDELLDAFSVLSKKKLRIRKNN